MLRLALVGDHRVGATYARIAPRLRKARFTAIADSDGATAQALAALIGAEVWAEDFDTLLAKHHGSFDAMLLHSASRFKEQHGARAAQAGKHILCQSPMALFRHEAAEIISVSRAARICLMIGQDLRFAPAIRVVKENGESGRLGEPGLLRIHRWQASECSPGLSDILPCDRPVANPLWPLLPEIDLACWLFGRGPEIVYATARREEKPTNTRGYVQLHLGFSDGGMALIDYAETLPKDDGYFSLSLIGSKGAAYADDHHNMQLLFTGGPPVALKTLQGDLHLLAQLQEFVEAVEQRREPAIGGTDGLRMIEVVEAAARSLAIGDSVRCLEEQAEDTLTPA
ncbi:MAG: Gfo/Idh/MocA family oxidoreductase [Verrucomicrobia bacterium]|nr:Gfo/Idh/MocA family oxidoreductase [Verrucomicrobiota bacterium]